MTTLRNSGAKTGEEHSRAGLVIPTPYLAYPSVRLIITPSRRAAVLY